MTIYTVENTKSGAILGDYAGETPLDAYRAMMADAGYATEAAAQSAGYTLAEIPADISVVAGDVVAEKAPWPTCPTCGITRALHGAAEKSACGI